MTFIGHLSVKKWSLYEYFVMAAQASYICFSFYSALGSSKKRTPLASN